MAEIDQEMQRRVGISSILPIWRLNGCQKIVINSGIIGPKFTKFLCDVERTSGVLMCPSAFPSCHPLWNRVPRRKAFLPIWRLKLVAMATSLERSRNEYQTEHLQPYVHQPWKFGELRSGMFWDLFAPIKKDERKRKKVTVAEHKPCRPSAWRANDQTPLQQVEYTDHCIYLFTVFHTQSFSHFQRHRDNISNDTNRVVRTVKKHPQEITQYVTCWMALISVTLSDLEGDCLQALWISYTWENMAHINFCKIHL